MSGPRPAIRRLPALTCLGFENEAVLAEAVNRLALRPDRELLPLSTCRRHELWVLTADRTIEIEGGRTLGEQTDAAARLFEIAAGARSGVPGEEAVADQVRLALRRAARHQLAGAVMTRLVRSALEAGRLLRDRVRRSTPILELQDLVADLVREHAARWARGKLEGDVILLGSGPVAISIREALIARGIEVTCWATRRPSRRSGPSFTLGEARARASRASAVIAALAGTDQLLDAAILPASSISIDVGVPGNVVGSAWTMSSIIAQAAPRLAPQAEAMRRAAHRIPALAERALAEALAPSVAPVAALVASFRSAVVKAEHDRLAPMLTELPPDVAERVYRSIAHAAARCVHPLHEMVNQLARQGRVHEAVTLVDHLLGTRVGFMDRSMKSADAGSSLRGRRPRRR